MFKERVRGTSQKHNWKFGTINQLSWYWYLEVISTMLESGCVATISRTEEKWTLLRGRFKDSSDLQLSKPLTKTQIMPTNRHRYIYLTLEPIVCLHICGSFCMPTSASMDSAKRRLCSTTGLNTGTIHLRVNVSSSNLCCLRVNCIYIPILGHFLTLSSYPVAKACSLILLMQLHALYIILERWGVEMNVTVIFLLGIPFSLCFWNPSGSVKWRLGKQAALGLNSSPQGQNTIWGRCDGQA